MDVETVPFAEAEAAYERLASGDRARLAVVFAYDGTGESARQLTLRDASSKPAAGEPGVAFLGAGNYAKALLLPAVAKTRGVQRVAVVTATGPSARRTAEKFDFARCGTDPADVFSDDSVDLVFVTTRHDSHAGLARDALRAGKAVWLEKPVGLAWHEVEEVLDAAAESGAQLAVGYNRRFSPHARTLRDAVADRHGPLSIHYVVAAGAPPAGTWVTDPVAGGGRVVGECCHFVDLCSWLVGAAPGRVFARSLSRERESDDSMVTLLSYPDGSVATLEYLASASGELPKERIEISADGRTVQCENFRTTKVVGGASSKTLNQDKGQEAAIEQVIAAVRSGGPSPFTLLELASTSAVTFAMEESMRSGQAVDLEERIARYR